MASTVNPFDVPANIDFDQWIHFLGDQESSSIHSVEHWRESIIGDLNSTGEKSGACLPWAKTQNHVRLRPAEISLWSGYNGHKKSMLLGMVMAWIARQQKVLIISLEMKPEVTAVRMIRQAANCYPSDGFANEFIDDMQGQIYIYDELDTVEAARILGVVNYAAAKLGCEHIVIDSLMKCGMSTDDYTAQKKFVDKLACSAKAHNIHVHLVAHAKKPDKGEMQRPGKYQVSGGADLTNLVDNVFIVWKDKQTADALLKRENGAPLSSDDMKALERPEQCLIIDKQRHDEFEGAFYFWFDKSSLQFTANEDRRPLPWKTLTAVA